MKKRKRTYRCTGHIDNIPVVLMLPADDMDDCIRIIDSNDWDMRPCPTRLQQCQRLAVRILRFLKPLADVGLWARVSFFMAGAVLNDLMRSVKTVALEAWIQAVLYGMAILGLAMLGSHFWSLEKRAACKKAVEKERLAAAERA
jgi:hypothetical protein